MASPLAATTLEMARLRMMTLEASLTRLNYHIQFGFATRRARRSNVQAEVHELGARVLANDAGVAANLNLRGALGDGARDDDNLLRGAGHSGGELCVAGHGGCSPPRPAARSAVLAGETGSFLERCVRRDRVERVGTYIVQGGALHDNCIFRCWGWHCDGRAGEETEGEGQVDGNI